MSKTFKDRPDKYSEELKYRRPKDKRPSKPYKRQHKDKLKHDYNNDCLESE